LCFKRLKRYGVNPFALVAGGLAYAAGLVTETVEGEEGKDEIQTRQTHYLDKKTIYTENIKIERN